MSRSPMSSDRVKLLDLEEKQLLSYLTFEGAHSFDCLLAEKVKVQPLRRKDIKEASRTYIEAGAAAHDPLLEYLSNTPDARNSRLYKRVQRLEYAISMTSWVRKNIGLTVNHGRGVVCAPPAPETTKKNKREKHIDEIYRLIVRGLDFIGKSKEQRKRLEEIRTKFTAFAEETLGEHLKEMRSVDALATSPHFQRRGYGSALVNAITKMADAEGRSTFLFSSNPVNTEFYNSLGFFTLGEVLFGDDNPTWKQPPIPIPLMVRIYGDQ